LRASSQVDSLSNLFYEPIIHAKNGGHGMGKKMAGRGGASKTVEVPVGTIVYRLRNAEREMRIEEDSRKRPTPKAFASRQPNAETHEAASVQSAIANPQSEIETLADFTRNEQEFMLCRGGAGGKGNVHFKSSRNRAPRQYTEGGEGEQGHFVLELRTIADAGLVGYPNAGKSTLLRKISAARPKVAPYPFTTLHPVVGVVEFGGYQRATVADIPGLIEGAHRGVGLGHEFLRHITRCRILMFVVDTAGSEGRNPVEDLQSLRREIDLYDPSLSRRNWFVIANKVDLPGAQENLMALRRKFPRVDIVAISAKTGEGIDKLREKIAGMLAE
jgi:GTPase